MGLYNDEFYENRDKMTRHSAETTIKSLMNHYHGNILSVIDLGCGVGTWLHQFKETAGVQIVKGVDGNYVNEGYLRIKKGEFSPADLTKPYRSGERFDLAMSLEVAEHLPPERAETFVDDLISFSDLVMFSAAVPHQGGVGHINEQPLSYWIELFEKRGYEFRDLIRPEIWNDEAVLPHYKQNIGIFVKRDSDSYNKLDTVSDSVLVDVIHPQLYLNKIKPMQGRLGHMFLKIESRLARLRG